jgi:hypothetical protein
MIRLLYDIRIFFWLILSIFFFILLSNSQFFNNKGFANSEVKISNYDIINKINEIYPISYLTYDEKKVWVDNTIKYIDSYKNNYLSNSDINNFNILVNNLINFKNNNSEDRNLIMLSIINVKNSTNFLYKKGEIL